MLNKDQLRRSLIKTGDLKGRQTMAEPDFKPDELGIIDFGVHEGKLWSSLSKDYLEYLISPDCNTMPERKEKARKELSNRKFAPGQISLL